MQTGTAFTVPDGLGSLRRGDIYHLVKSERNGDRVFVARFNDCQACADLLVVTRPLFEQAIESGGIVASDPAGPAWLSPLAGLDLESIDAQRRRATRSHQSRVAQRMTILEPALRSLDAIFSSDDPYRALNKLARAARPPQNETRFRFWVVAYLCFGERGLWPATAKNGRWVRDGIHHKKAGRRSKYGAQHGYACTEEMKELIKRGYHKFSGAGITMKKIYALSMCQVFGCKTRTTKNGATHYVQPKGKPFPTRHQFRYWVHKLIGQGNTSRVRFGDQRVRSGQASRGRYSQETSNLLERVESDSFTVNEYPRSLISDAPLPPLYVVRAICVLSGMIVGIGFSLGSERQTAYKMAMFSMALPKDEFCRLFGMQIQRSEWPCMGISPNPVLDRGPAWSDGFRRSLEGKCGVIEVTPSHTPQSHGSIEASHPRSDRPQSAPSFIVSKLSPVEMARRAIYDAIRHNRASSAQARMTPEMLRAGILPTPLNVWKFLDKRGRNDGLHVAKEDAVRRFLTPIECTVQRNGDLLFKKNRYASRRLFETGLLDKIKRGKCATTIDGYAMDMCMRHIWVRAGRELVEVDLQLPIRDDTSQLDLGVMELTEMEQKMRRDRTLLEDNKPAATSRAIERDNSVLGRSAEGGHRKAGRPRHRTAAAREEVAFLSNRQKRGVFA